MNKNIIYFCREYNDIDHVVPIADELLNNADVNSLCFFNYNLNKSFTDDYRICYLKRHKNFSYIDYNNVLNKKEKFLLSWLRILQKIHNYFDKLKSNYINNLYKNTKVEAIGINKENLIFLFDHTNSVLLDVVYTFSNKFNIPLGLLMHGLDPTENLLMKTNMLKIKELDNNWNGFNKSDIFFVNNKHYKNRSVSNGVAKKIIKEVGSARFSNKWSKILTKITPNIDLPDPNKKLIKVVIMLNKYRYNIWKEEIDRVIKTLLLIENVFIIIKPHTRNMKFDSYKDERIFVADENCHSRKLFEWADLSLFTISSIFLDALLLDKPILFLRLATSNKLSCDSIMKNWNVDSRDDLIYWINQFKENRGVRTYTEAERIKCLNYYVNDHDNQLLSRYSKSILELKKRNI